MNEKINFLSVSEMSVKTRSGEITSRQVVEACIAQIKSHNPVYNAVVFLNGEEALRQADRADMAFASGKSTGLLHGIPITIKDTYQVKGMPATAGYPPLKNYIPDEDAVIVKLLKEQGAIVLGKTNTPTLAMDIQTDNPLFGRTNNPWDVTLTPSGSSGGCATALATGMTTLSFGSDLAGSIRLPSAFCGVYGFKPTHGVLSLEGHIPPLPGTTNGIRTIAVSGPLARSAGDLILAMKILSEPNPYDRFVAPVLPDSDTLPDIKNLKIAWSDNFGNVPVSREIKEKMNDYLKKLADAGAVVERAEPPGMDYVEIWELWGTFVRMQSGFEMSNFKRAIGDFFTKDTVKHIPMHRRIVGPISVEKLMKAFELQSRYVTKMDNFLSEYDAWICPVCSSTAFKHHAHSKSFGDFKIYNNPLVIDGQKVPYYVATQSYTTVFSTTNSPVVSMPIGMGESGLPVNVQVAGKRYHDFRLLNTAKVLEQYAEKMVYPLHRKE